MDGDVVHSLPQRQEACAQLESYVGFQGNLVSQLSQGPSKSFCRPAVITNQRLHVDTLDVLKNFRSRFPAATVDCDVARREHRVARAAAWSVLTVTKTLRRATQMMHEPPAHCDLHAESCGVEGQL